MKDKAKICFQLKVDRDLWNRFKAKVPRNITLNDAVLSLIKREAEK